LQQLIVVNVNWTNFYRRIEIDIASSCY